MMVQSVYHLYLVGYRLYVERTRLSMLPGIQDLRAAMQALLYNLRLSDERPLEGRYNFAEKAEYWALIWGTVVMGITGFMLWNPIATAQVMPGEFIPAAKAAHGGEALLAVLAIIVWHFYSVHIKALNLSMFDGKLTEREMEHEHPLELAEIKAGTATRIASPEEINQRRRIYVPVALTLALAMTAGIYFFVSFEKTALTTVPPMEKAAVYAPLPPTPFPTIAPIIDAELTWKGGVGELFQRRCGECHGSQFAEGGLDTSDYQRLLAGGDTGSGIILGEPHDGEVYSRQVAGDHEGQFNGEEMAVVQDWIEIGAPEE